MQNVPIARAIESQQLHIDALVASISTMGAPALEQLLNSLVYELYFPDDLHERGLHLFDATRSAGLDRLADLEGEKLAQAAAEFTRQHLAPGQPLQVMVSDLQTLDVVRIIEGKA